MNAKGGPPEARRAKEGASAYFAEEMKDTTAVRRWYPSFFLAILSRLVNLYGGKSQDSRLDCMPRRRCNLPVEVRSGELSIHPGSEDPVLRGDPQD